MFLRFPKVTSVSTFGLPSFPNLVLKRRFRLFRLSLVSQCSDLGLWSSSYHPFSENLLSLKGFRTTFLSLYNLSPLLRGSWTIFPLYSFGFFLSGNLSRVSSTFLFCICNSYVNYRVLLFGYCLISSITLCVLQSFPLLVRSDPDGGF